MQDKLVKLARELQHAGGQAVRTVATYGSIARGDHRADQSDVNLLIVLEPASIEVLGSLRPAISSARDELRLAPFVVDQSELRHAADAFAAKLADIQLAYQVLAGDDTVASLEIQFEHLRLACERDLRSVALRLRRAYVLGAARPAMLRVTLERSLPTIFGALRVLRARGRPELIRDREALITACAQELDFDPAPLRAAARARAQDDLHLDLVPVYRDLIPCADRIVGAIDRLAT